MLTVTFNRATQEELQVGQESYFKIAVENYDPQQHQDWTMFIECAGIAVERQTSLADVVAAGGYKEIAFTPLSSGDIPVAAKIAEKTYPAKWYGGWDLNLEVR